MDPTKAAKLKRQEELSSLFAVIFDEMGDLLGAEQATLFLLDDDGKSLWSRIGKKSDAGSQFHVPVGDSIVGLCVKEGRSLRVDDMQRHPKFYKSIDRQLDFKSRDCLVAPIMDYDGRVCGAVEVLNSRNQDGFSSADERLLNAFCSHIGIVVQDLNHEDDDRHVHEALLMIKQQKKYQAEVEKML